MAEVIRIPAGTYIKTEDAEAVRESGGVIGKNEEFISNDEIIEITEGLLKAYLENKEAQ